MDAYSVSVKIGLDQSSFNRDLESVGGKLASFGNAVKSGFGAVAKVSGAAITAAAGGVAALTKSSVTSYANYQQMIGGVQKLYGNMGMTLTEYAQSAGKAKDEVYAEWESLEHAQNLVLKNAQNAYKESGMSANQYMEMATSFSASLINSLGGNTVKAAEQTDVAMKAISDNFNTFGGDIGMIQGAFQGFAKQNYTMLDNLKLGYGGTKEEMKRLIEDANEYGKTMGMAGDLSIESFSDVVTAIDLIQQKQHIAGTTAREASTTIEGSLQMVKASWENLVTGLADPDADLGELISQMVDSASIAAGNLIPAVEKALDGVGQLIEQVAPVISDHLPALIESVLPSLISAATTLVSGIASALPSIITVLIEQIPSVVTQLGSALIECAGQLGESLMQLMSMALAGINNFDWAGAATNIATSLTNAFSGEGVSAFISTASAILSGIVSGIGQALPILIPAAMEIVAQLANDLSEQIPILFEAAGTLITGLVEGLYNADAISGLLDAGINLCWKIGEAVGTQAPQIIAALVRGLVSAAPQMALAGPTLIVALVGGLLSGLAPLLDAGVQMITQLVSTIQAQFGKIMTAGQQLLMKFIEGIKAKFGELANTARNIIETVKKAITEKIAEAKKWGADLMTNFIGGITEKLKDLKNAVAGIGTTISSQLHFSEPDEGVLSDFHTWAPDMMELFAQGIRDNTHLITDQLNKSFDFRDIMEAPFKEADASSNGANLSEVVNLLTQIRDKGTVVILEGDASRMFRVMQSESRKYYQTTGKEAFA